MTSLSACNATEESGTDLPFWKTSCMDSAALTHDSDKEATVYARRVARRVGVENVMSLKD